MSKHQFWQIFEYQKNLRICKTEASVWKNEKGPDKMFKTQLNCAPYVAPSDLKEIQHLVRAFTLNCHNFTVEINVRIFTLTLFQQKFRESNAFKNESRKS